LCVWSIIAAFDVLLHSTFLHGGQDVQGRPGSNGETGLFQARGTSKMLKTHGWSMGWLTIGCSVVTVLLAGAGIAAPPPGVPVMIPEHVAALAVRTDEAVQAVGPAEQRKPLVARPAAGVRKAVAGVRKPGTGIRKPRYVRIYGKSARAYQRAREAALARNKLRKRSSDALNAADISRGSGSQVARSQ
jgi:hypothetical protein